MALTDEQWSRYEERYGRLMHTISMKISGDEALANPEDNYSDLCVAAIESISGFERKTGMSFDKAFDTKLFDQYTKTVLWNRKAKKGIPLTKRMAFRNKHLSIDFSPGYDTSDCGSLTSVIPDTKFNIDLSSIEMNDLIQSQKPDVKAVLGEIVLNPNLIKPDGTINRTALEESTGFTYYKVSKVLEDIKKVLNKEMTNEQ
jgi:hypothetical protein